MKKQLYYMLLIILVAGLTACGLQGPLYLPPTDMISKKIAKRSPLADERTQKSNRNHLV